MHLREIIPLIVLFLLISVVAAATNAQVSVPATVNFQVSSDGNSVLMDGVNIGEKQNNYVSPNLMVYKALGLGYAGSTASVPNQYTSTGAAIQYDAGSGLNWYYVSEVKRQSAGDPFAGKQSFAVSWEKPLLPSKDWTAVSTEGDTAIVSQGQDIHVITNGNLQLPGTFTVYSGANDQSVASTTISDAQKDCSSPNQRCSATVSTSGLTPGYYYVTYSSGSTISAPMYIRIGPATTDGSSSLILKDAKTGEAKTFSVTTTRVTKDVAEGTVSGTDLKFYVWKNSNSPGISSGEIKTNAVYTLGNLGLTFTVETDWATVTKLVFSNGKVIELKLDGGKIKVDTSTPGDWGSGVTAKVNSDGSLVLTTGGTTTPPVTKVPINNNANNTTVEVVAKKPTTENDTTKQHVTETPKLSKKLAKAIYVLDTGWVSTSTAGEPIFTNTDCDEAPYGFVHIKEKGKYISIDEASKILGKDRLKKLLGKSPIWIYGRQKCKIEYEIEKETSYKDFELTPGQNSIFVTKDMQGKTLSTILNGCYVESISEWDGNTQRMVKIEIGFGLKEEDVGKGLFVKTKNSCTLGEEKPTITETPFDQQLTPVLVKWEDIKWSEVPKKNTDPITCSKDGETFFKDTVNGCRAQGGAVQECIRPQEIPKIASPRVVENYSVNINLRLNWDWLNNLTRDVNRTGVANNTYNATSFDCDDFADGLEKKLTEKGYNATFTYIGCWDGVNVSTVTGHAITDVHAPNGDIIFIEPQNERVLNGPMDKDGDGVIEIRRNERQDGFLHETDDHCMIDVYDSKEAAEAAGLVMD